MERPVSDVGALSLALKAAQSGDVILLAPGTYAGLAALSGLSFDPAVTITSADPSKPAVLTSFAATSVTGLTLDLLELQATTGFMGFPFSGCRRITVSRCTLHGDPALTADAQVQGALEFKGCDAVSVTGNLFSNLRIAATFSKSTNLKVSGNRVTEMGNDGFDFAEVAFVEVTDNTLHDFRPKVGVHPDPIQFWTQGTSQASHDILVARNVIVRTAGLGGSAGGTQGIFIGDEVGTLPFKNLTIRDNFIANRGVNACRVTGSDGLVITGNVLPTVIGDDNWTTILAQKALSATITGNTSCYAIGVSAPLDKAAMDASADPTKAIYVATTNITSPNTTLPRVTPEQHDQMLADWRSKYPLAPAFTWSPAAAAPEPTPEPQPAPTPAPPQVPAEDPRIAQLEALLEQARADLLTANGAIAARDTRITALVANRAKALVLANQALTLATQARAARAKNAPLDQLIPVLRDQQVPLLSAPL